jgi:two-component system alkaline phosphatase synthesis response regulator PhoP
MSSSDGDALKGDELRERRILVVDDEEDVRLFVATVLEDAGAEVIEARDGDEALARARDWRPDLITLDLSMPGKDGMDAFSELREDPGTGDIAICILTGHPQFRRLIYERPVRAPEGYLNKPVNEVLLVSTIRRILGLRDRKAAEGEIGDEVVH